LPNANAIFSRKLTNKEICRAAFYIGWKGLRKGSNYYDDSEWLRLAVETSEGRLYEYHQAWNWLSTLQTEVGHQGVGIGKKEIRPVPIDAPPASPPSHFNGVCVVHVD